MLSCFAHSFFRNLGVLPLNRLDFLLVAGLHRQMTVNISTLQEEEHSYLSPVFQPRYDISRIALGQLRDISELLLFFSIVEIGGARLPLEPPLADEGLLIISSGLLSPLRCSKESTGSC